MYRPALSLIAVRDRSMRAGLDASTVTPGRTAPVESRTTPEIVACARAIAGTISAISAPTATIRTCFRIRPSMPRAYERATTLTVTDGALIAPPAAAAWLALRRSEKDKDCGGG